MSIQILQNTLKFLERVQTTGVEAYAWCEAHSYLTQEAKRLAQDVLKVPQEAKSDPN
jgi:hypothetical protein